MAQEEYDYEYQKKQKKKKKKNSVYIMTNVYNTDEEIPDSESQIRSRLKSIMRQHIGISNSISPVELFYSIYSTYPNELNVYKRNYYWELVKKELRRFRKENELFTIIKGSKIFVLYDEVELDYYLKRADRHIKSIKNLKVNAKNWVKNKKWKKL